MNLSPVMIAHLATVGPALILGAAMLIMKKGSTLHRYAGRIWALLMLSTALISFGIQRSGSFSWIHLLSVWVVVNIAIALYAIYRRNILMHQRFMTGLYIGTAIAGAFTLLPQRELGKLVWGAFGLV